MAHTNLLARRLAAKVLVFGCLLTLAATTIQIGIEFSREKAGLLEDLDRAMLGSQNVLTQSLWQVDPDSTRLILEGLLHLPGVHYAAVIGEDGRGIAAGEPAGGEVVLRSLPLAHAMGGDQVRLGNFVAEADFESVKALVQKRAILVLASQGLLVFAVAGFILAVHYNLIGRHIRRIAALMGGRGIDNLDESLELDRVSGERPDELDTMMSAIRRMLTDTARAIRAERASTELAASEIERRRDAESALGESESRYRTLFEEAADALFILDMTGRVQQVNQAACASLGYTREELTGMTLASIDTPESLAKVPERMQRLAREGRLVFESEHRRKDGSVMPVEVHVQIIDYEGGRAILSSCRDIGERRKADARLRAQNRYLSCHLLVSELALSSGGELDLCRIICSQISQALGFPNVSIQFYDAGRDVMIYQGVVENFLQVLPYEVPAEGTVCKAVVQSGDAAVRNVSAPPAPGCLGTMPTDMRTVLCFPMRQRDRIVGVLSLSSSTVEDAGEGLTAWAGSMANYVAALIEHKRAEYKVAASLREKDILLREIHHRVKNNLQIVSSLLRLQAGHIADPVALTHIEESQSRVMAMALVHEELYKTSDLAQVAMPEYLTRLTQRIFSIFSHGRDIERVVEAENIAVNIDKVVPMGLILNELTVNALKHAFAGRDRGRLTVRFGNDGDDYLLQVVDDGQGLPHGFDPESSQGLGMQLVVSLTEQLRGRFEFESRDGTRFALRFPKSR